MCSPRRSFFVVLFWTLSCAMVPSSVALTSARVHATTAQEAVKIEGRELFDTYCASCHGVTGVGNGPAASAMRRTPPDITGLASANGGVFPLERARRIIDGREVEAHGARDMPVWGDAFKALRGARSEEDVRARISAILDYLASIQRRRA